MGWEELAESLDDLETKEVYDGNFCSVKDAVVIIILGSLCGLQNFKQIHEWAITEHVRSFLEKEFGIKRIPCYWWLLSLIAEKLSNVVDEKFRDLFRLQSVRFHLQKFYLL